MFAIMHSWGHTCDNRQPTWNQVEPHLGCLGAYSAHPGVNLGVLVIVLPPTWPVLERRKNLNCFFSFFFQSFS